MSNAIINLITRDTTKEQMKTAYENYPDVSPKGFELCNSSTVEPIICEIPKGASVLDLGCNSGELMKMLKEKGCRVIGVDVSDVALKIAEGKGLKVFKASAEKLPFKDKRFDVVVMREVLTHIHDPLEALKEVRRVLKPNGFLIGSAPHSNLERIVWDDARLHHRYYNEETIEADLSQSFKGIHLKVLNGAQFMISFSQSLLADKPAEILFKCGGENLPPWEDALLKDKETLRVWMGPTQPPGDVYYRMTGFAEKMKKIEGVEVGYDRFSYRSTDGCSEWQRKLLQNEKGEPTSALALHDFEKCVKVTNPLVFQITYYEDVLDLFKAIKEAYPDKKLVTECDDWLFDVPAYNIASNPYSPGSPKERIAFEQIRISDAVIVSTSFIKEGLLKLFPEKVIHVVPNAIDFDLWDSAVTDGKMELKKEGVVRIGYTGCQNHSGDMEIIKPVLLGLLDEFPNLEVILSDVFFKDVNHPRLICPKRWVDIIEYPFMVKGWDLDIGIAPLRDNNFNRAKSNLRWLEFSALKIPTVASKVRPFEESIQKGEGYLCSTKQEWYDRLKNLIVSPVLREAVGSTAYDRVKSSFNMDKVSRNYAEILKGIRS